MTVKTQSKPKLSDIFNSENFQTAIRRQLGGSELATKTFVSSVLSATNNNVALQECTPASIMTAGLLGESLKLSPSPQLGHYYMVPFNDSKTNTKVAQFQLGYKGYIQLAIRSGQYKRINVVAVKDGELKGFDPYKEEINVKAIENPLEREKANTIGYYSFFELTNGFTKEIYWSKEQMQEHALKYSKGYRAKKGYTFWEKDFDGMAFKTMLRHMISKWGVMTIELQTAYNNDMGVINEDGSVNYVDNDNDDARTNYDEVKEQNIIEADTKETVDYNLE